MYEQRKIEMLSGFAASGHNGRWSTMVNTGNHELDAKMQNYRSHAADAIKNLNDFNMISNQLVLNGKYMDNAMFVMGCNFGLRCSDLVNLKFEQIVDDNGEFYKGIAVIEKKTSHGRLRADGTRSRPKPPRKVPINERSMDAFNLYAGSLHWNFSPDDYMFPNRAKDGPMTYQGVYSKFMRLIDERRGKLKLENPIHGSTHFMRKTFAYHYIMSPYGERNRKIESLQKAFGHASLATTLSYAGITDDEIYDNVMHMNIGRYLPLEEIIVGDLNAGFITGPGLVVLDND